MLADTCFIKNTPYLTVFMCKFHEEFSAEYGTLVELLSMAEYLKSFHMYVCCILCSFTSGSPVNRVRNDLFMTRTDNSISEWLYLENLSSPKEFPSLTIFGSKFLSFQFIFLSSKHVTLVKRISKPVASFAFILVSISFHAKKL